MREPLRVERVDPLRSQNQIQHQPARGAKQQQRARVLRPALLLLRIDAEHAVHEPLDRAQPAYKRDSLALIHPRHVAAQQRRQAGQQRDQHNDLNPARDRHRGRPG